MTDSSAEEFTVEVGIRRWVISDESKMWALYRELRSRGWYGGIMSFENVDGEKMQMTKDGQQLLVELGNVVVEVNELISSLSADDYAARYGGVA